MNRLLKIHASDNFQSIVNFMATLQVRLTKHHHIIQKIYIKLYVFIWSITIIKDLSSKEFKRQYNTVDKSYTFMLLCYWEHQSTFQNKACSHYGHIILQVQYNMNTRRLFQMNVEMEKLTKKSQVHPSFWYGWVFLLLWYQNKEQCRNNPILLHLR